MKIKKPKIRVSENSIESVKNSNNFLFKLLSIILFILISIVIVLESGSLGKSIEDNIKEYEKKVDEKIKKSVDK